MQNLDTLRLAIAVYTLKPLLDTRIEHNLATRLLKRLTTQRVSLRLRLTNHQRHIGQNLIGILLLGHLVGIAPKLLVALAYGRNKVILLHIARSKRSVKIVYQRNGKLRSLALAHSGFSYIYLPQR